MLLFLIALFMLFAASIVGYIIVSLLNPNAPGLGAVSLPAGLWVSTVIMLTSSFTMHRALDNVRYERQTRFRSALLLTAILAVGFVLVQTPSMMSLLQQHQAQLEAMHQPPPADPSAVEQPAPAGQDQAVVSPDGQPVREGIIPDPRPVGLYGMVFVLILVHALHVVGGLVPMFVVLIRAQAGVYDHENHQAVKHLAWYWHFLDGIWLMMFLALLITA